MIKSIESLTNPLIKHVVKLHNVKHRRASGEFIAEGFKTIATLINSGSQLVTLFATETFLYDAKHLIADEKIMVITEPILEKISTAQTPSGLLAIFKIPLSPALSTLADGLVLAQISDPGNMGTLIRTAAAMGKKTVVCIETVDPWNPKVIQATVGTIGNVSIFSLSWDELITHKKNIPLCALVAREGKNPSQLNLRNTLLVVGNESTGLPEEWIDQCEEKMTLPMPGNTESLNAGVAGSIALYLAATQ